VQISRWPATWFVAAKSAACCKPSAKIGLIRHRRYMALAQRGHAATRAGLAASAGKSSPPRRPRVGQDLGRCRKRPVAGKRPAGGGGQNSYRPPTKPCTYSQVCMPARSIRGNSNFIGRLVHARTGWERPDYAEGVAAFMQKSEVQSSRRMICPAPLPRDACGTGDSRALA